MAFEDMLLRKFDEFQSDLKCLKNDFNELATEYSKYLNLHKILLRIVEMLMGKIARENHKTPQGGLPSDTILNLKGK